MKRRRLIPLEDMIHGAIVDLLRLKADPRTIWFHPPNSIPANARVGARFKRLGMVAGAPDLLIIGPDGIPHFIEVKTAIGALSEHQRRFADRCAAIGVDYEVVRSSIAAEELLASWGALKRNEYRRLAA